MTRTVHLYGLSLESCSLQERNKSRWVVALSGISVTGTQRSTLIDSNGRNSVFLRRYGLYGGCTSPSPSDSAHCTAHMSSCCPSLTMHCTSPIRANHTTPSVGQDLKKRMTVDGATSASQSLPCCMSFFWCF